LPSWVPSLDYHMVALMANWLANLSVELGSTLSLTTFMSHIGVGE
jgi:hypothetical protein